MKKFVYYLLICLLFSNVLNAFDISGDLDFWKMEDFIGFDEIGDCSASCGDITSVFSRIENEILYLRITFDDMVQRTHNQVVKDNFQDKDITAVVTLYACKGKKELFRKAFPLQYLVQKNGDEKILRTPACNTIECSIPFVTDFPKEELTYKVDILIGDVVVDNFISKGNTQYRGGNCAFVHHGNQGLTYTEVFYGQDPHETSGFDEVLEVHEATNIPGNFHMSGTLMPAAEWHNPEFNDWLETGAASG
ncbi:MAG: hypothetical protein H8E22_00015, partial [Candidatus Cloacimonetes bacterium]|nr:hypothetical protein [Candidatus Cloacimonadota bacterium]